MASRKRIVICYILLQASFWGMLSSICAYQAAVVLDRGFTAGQAGIFCALCYFASLFTQPVIGGWADRHPEVPLKRLLIVMLLPAIALNLVFYFTRPNFLLTALTFFLFGVLETNSYPLIDSMGMQYVNAGVQIPYSLSRGIGSLSYALLCVATGLLTARFGVRQPMPSGSSSSDKSRMGYRPRARSGSRRTRNTSGANTSPHISAPCGNKASSSAARQKPFHRLRIMLITFLFIFSPRAPLPGADSPYQGEMSRRDKRGRELSAGG